MLFLEVKVNAYFVQVNHTLCKKEYTPGANKTVYGLCKCLLWESWKEKKVQITGRMESAVDPGKNVIVGSFCVLVQPLPQHEKYL